MPVGRPLKFKTPAILKKKVDAYFKYCDDNDEPYLITDLAVFLDTSRQTLMEYGGEYVGMEKGKTEAIKQQFIDIIKKAKGKCEAWLYKAALLNKVNPTVAIFGMKANHKWRTEEPQTLVQNIIQESNPEKDRQVEELLNREGLK